LAAIRRLLDAENTTGTCPSCEMPFDKGKKRRLIDNCGHERCYSCMFTNEACPLCSLNGSISNSDGEYLNSVRFADGIVLIAIANSSEELQAQMNKLNTDSNKGRQELSPTRSEIGHPEKLPKIRPKNAKNRLEQNVMTQSCPTPPQSRRKFFLNPKAIRSPFLGRGWRQQADGAMSASMTSSATSTEGKHWPSVVLGKIRSLWKAGHSGPGAGLNQLASDDEASLKTPSAKKSSENDMYMRLGLLLGDGARRSKGNQGYNLESCSSLASYETSAMMSTNTSPVSTLTGSSEDPHRTNPSSDSVASLMSMSMSGQSNCSTSPVSRRHSVTTAQPGQIEDLNLFKNRRTCIRRSARTGIVIKGAIDPKIRFAQYKAPQLTLKPLFFEVPLQEPDPLFLGRHWLFKKMEEIIGSPGCGILLTGNTGTGKTALILQLVEYSCFGRRKEPLYQSVHSPERSRSPPSTIYGPIDLVSEKIKKLASTIVAYHFCQADNNNTCLVPDFIHSLAAQLCQAPQLVAYREHLLNETTLQNVLSLKECIANPDVALTRGILEPLSSLKRVGKIDNITCTILVDALCEAEYHRSDNGDTITTFLLKHIPNFPPWLKVVATVRTQLQELTKQFPFTRISLDNTPVNENIQKIFRYINFRLQNRP
ncbi:protein TANC1-like, partial [Sitophilus oryzae]|uniref:Protein TANC1-like n=1 Tax=Sitophilus oryzae TaxID=7048 RepID=A0A6J2YK61_SITOR